MTESRGSTRFDRDTGQVYREQLVVATSSSSSSSLRRGRTAAAAALPPLAWHQEPAYTDTTRRRRRGTDRRGPASLVDMAVKLAADNMARVGVDALRRCPAGLVWRVWDYLDHRRRGVNFHAWKTILLALPDPGHPRTGAAPPRLLRYHQVLPNPQAPLQAYLDPLAASPFQFLAGVVIGRGARFDASELLALPRLRNLAFLAIVQPPGPGSPTDFPRVTDRLVREWALLPDPFPALRSLLIANQGQTTARSLVLAARFPALEVYAVGGRRADWDGGDDDDDPSAVADGWRRQEWRVDDLAAKAAAAVAPPSLPPAPYAHLELGHGPPYRDRCYEAQYAFHRVRPGFHVDKRRRKGRGKEEEEGKKEEKGKGKGQDARAQPGPSQPPRAKRLKGLQDVFQSFGA